MTSEFLSTGFPIQDLARFGPNQTAIPTESQAAAYCRSLAKKHYENFSVATFLLPRDVREHFYPVYAFCRWADDLGDETTDADALLAWWEMLLERFYAEEWQPGLKRDEVERNDRIKSPNLSPFLSGRSASLREAPVPAAIPATADVIHPVFIALKPTVREFGIPKTLFSDLLVAFRRDQTVKEYETRDALLDYCRHSANPVGRLILHLARTTDDESLRLSDAVCTGLQLANFWQDVARDWDEKGRIYLPREDRLRFGVTDEMFRNRRATPEFRELLREETAWAESFFRTGIPLADRVPRSFSRDIKLFSAGGLAILDAIRRQNYDVWTRRPRISKWRKIRLLVRCLIGF